MTERPYQRLIAWKEAYKLCLLTYSITRSFPKEERYGLTAQMRRSAYSVPINIAEGNTKKSQKDRARFFEIALASINELHCECLLAKDLQYLEAKGFLQLDSGIQKTSYLLTKLHASIVPSRFPRSL